jgi:hypothetical protein
VGINRNPFLLRVIPKEGMDLPSSTLQGKSFIDCIKFAIALGGMDAAVSYALGGVFTK